MMGQGFGDKIATNAARDIFIMLAIAAAFGAGICLLILWSIGKL
jgi:hypothetical protein